MRSNDSFTQSENDEFLELDELVVAGDTAAIAYGWAANAWLDRQAVQSKADPDSRAAFSYALTRLTERHGHYLSRAQIADRLRIARAFPRQDCDDLAEEMHYRFTFSELRAAYVADDRERTLQLLLWAAETQATPAEIYAKKTGRAEMAEEDKAWGHLVEWASKFLDRLDGLRAPDGLRDRKIKVARVIVGIDMEERASVTKTDL